MYRLISRKYWCRWWSREAGGREIFWLALPLIISASSFALMQLTDRILLTWYDTHSMGASFSGGQFAWLLVSLPFCIAGYANAYVAQYNGAKEYSRIASFVWQGVFVGLAIVPVLCLVAPFCDFPFRLFGHSDRMINLESTYLFYCLWGLPAQVANEALSSYFSGRKKMNVVMSVNIIAILINIVLDCVLIFGVAGFFRYGIAGAAIATSVSQWLRGLIYFGWIFHDSRREPTLRFFQQCRFYPRDFLSLIRLGSMSGIQFIVEMLVYTFFILIVGRVGDVATMATAIAFNMNTLAVLPIFGIGLAVMTIVGNHLGADRPDLARTGTISALVLGMLLTGFFVFLFFFFPNFCLYLYSLGDPEAFEPLRVATIPILRIVSLYLFFDMMNVILCSAIKGAGDTKFPMWLTIVMAPVLIVPLLFALHYNLLDVTGCWILLTVWLCLLCLVYSFRFFQGKWMSLRLLEKGNGE